MGLLALSNMNLHVALHISYVEGPSLDADGEKVAVTEDVIDSNALIELENVELNDSDQELLQEADLDAIALHELDKDWDQDGEVVGEGKGECDAILLHDLDKELVTDSVMLLIKEGNGDADGILGASWWLSSPLVAFIIA